MQRAAPQCQNIKNTPWTESLRREVSPHLFPDSRLPQRASCGARSVTSDLICGLKRGFPCREFKLSKIMISGIIMGFMRLFSPLQPLLPPLPPDNEDATMSPGVSPALVKMYETGAGSAHRVCLVSYLSKYTGSALILAAGSKQRAKYEKHFLVFSFLIDQSAEKIK